MVTLALFAAMVASSWTEPLQAKPRHGQLMSFAATMAKNGNWREARFRWEQALAAQPENPRLHNNLGVAFEALGLADDARRHYELALKLAPGDEKIRENQMRFDRFWRKTEGGSDSREPRPPVARGGSAGGKKLKVTIPLPVPARMDLDGNETLLVASFLAPESGLLDINREFVRYLRSELRKHAPVRVLDVTPAPAVPEQTLEDLLLNREFWKYLGGQYDADLIVTGIVSYQSSDYSGFRDVDRINPSTGQKVRRSEFVEQEKFDYEVDLLFFSGETGELKFRDRLQRQAVFRGASNDPITAFYEMSESMAPDILAIVRPRTRQANRTVFKK